MKYNIVNTMAFAFGAAILIVPHSSQGQVNAFLSAQPNAVFGASRLPAETTFTLPGNTAATNLVPAVTYKLTNKGVSMRLDVVGFPRHALYAPVVLGDGHIIGTLPAVSLPADTNAVALANRRPTTVKGPDWRFAIYNNVVQANNAITAWANNGRGATVLEPTAAQDRVQRFVDTRLIEWLDPAFDPLAPAAGSLVGFNYTTAKDPAFTPAYLVGKVIVIYGPKRVNTAAKTGANNPQDVGYATRDAIWVTPALR